MSLEQFGWNSHFENEFARLREPGVAPARVALVDRERFVVWNESGESEVSVSGRLRHDSGIWPAVGDWVVLQNGARITAVLPRRTSFSRKQPGAVTRQQVIAANIDVLFIVSGLDRDFNARRLERYLLMAWESGAQPVVVLNKADLCADTENAAASIEPLASGAPILIVSALEDRGLAALEAHLETAQTTALVGSSGAGKSTLVNRLLGQERQRVQDVSVSDGRGRHTTVRRELILAPKGWLLIDTPGLRELQPWADTESADVAFADIAALAAECRFRNCKHQGEPGCAVATAGVEVPRLANYAKMQRELAHLERQQDQRAAQEEKRRIKRIMRAMRNMYRT
jgi:ribosome biogenesis GTPase